MRRLLGVLAVTVLAGCGGAGSDSQNAQTASTTASPTAVLDRYSDVVEIDDFYAFAAITLDGTEVEGESYRDKQLALWFWAPW